MIIVVFAEWTNEILIDCKFSHDLFFWLLRLLTTIICCIWPAWSKAVRFFGPSCRACANFAGGSLRHRHQSGGNNLFYLKFFFSFFFLFFLSFLLPLLPSSFSFLFILSSLYSFYVLLLLFTLFSPFFNKFYGNSFLMFFERYGPHFIVGPLFKTWYYCRRRFLLITAPQHP